MNSRFGLVFAILGVRYHYSAVISPRSLLTRQLLLSYLINYPVYKYLDEKIGSHRNDEYAFRENILEILSTSERKVKSKKLKTSILLLVKGFFV